MNMVKTFIAAPGPFPISKAVLHNDKYTLEISGQIGFDTKTGKMGEGIEQQTKITLENIKSILAEVEWDMDTIIKTRVYLADMKDYEAMNKVYREYFAKDYPARVAMAVKELPRGALVEIECTASGESMTDTGFTTL